MSSRPVAGRGKPGLSRPSFRAARAGVADGAGTPPWLSPSSGEDDRLLLLQEVLLKRAADLVEALYGMPHNNQVGDDSRCASPSRQQWAGLVGAMGTGLVLTAHLAGTWPCHGPTCVLNTEHGGRKQFQRGKEASEKALVVRRTPTFPVVPLGAIPRGAFSLSCFRCG